MTQLRKDLVEAVKDGKYDTVQGMLSSGLYTDFHDEAMFVAAGSDQVKIIELSADFGVRDITGKALEVAIRECRVESIKCLLKLYEKDSLDHVNLQGPWLLVLTVHKCIDLDPGNPMGYFGPKLVRWLMGAGANLVSALDFINHLKAHPSYFERMPTVGAILRLLLQEEAVHAESWLWRREEDSTNPKQKKISTTIRVVRRRVTSRVVMGGMLRYTRKIDPGSFDV